ncbi:beta-aspartyl-peptidase [candidate division GN15 bacterium]|uniref:Beta-aspartyl-peptidase n=1 Tax=candidate division GN15 bacterium TaxID=2072418 RepID=A0A855XBY7_9BACT|nr:MAG: beta-aspartyl-peptidase [candidate division GN15 bacterium]
MNFAIAIHGGAGTIRRQFMTPEKEAEYRAGLAESLEAGYGILRHGGSALDAVMKAVIAMENNPLFNAGKGAVFTHEGTNEQDACVMDGSTRAVGAVAAVKHIASPVTLARMVMERSKHVLLCGEGAERFAVANGMTLVEPEYFYTKQRWDQLQLALKEEAREHKQEAQLDHSDHKKMGTVGAVALDNHGNLAAATSTGGMTNKRYGRIGDTPIIGAGTYADNATCAISATGVGEFIMRAVLAHDIAALMQYKNMTLADAANLVVMEKLTALGGSGGLVAIDWDGNIVMPFNSEGMYRGYKLADGTGEIAIFKD